MDTNIDPFGGLISGMLAGHDLGMRIKRQQQEDQAFKTKQILDQQKASVEDIMNQMTLQENARPVKNGNVSLPSTSYSVASAVPGLPDFQAGVPGGDVPADPNRTVNYSDSRGNQKQYELLSPEGFKAKAAEAAETARQQKTADISTEEQAKVEAQERARANARQFQLKAEGGGTPAPEGLETVGVQPGTPMTRAELVAAQGEVNKLKQDAINLRKSNRVDLAPGHTLYEPDDAGAPSAQLNAAGPAAAPGAPPAAGAPGSGLRAIATADPAATTDFEKSFLPKFLLKIGKTPQNADLDDLVHAHQAYANATKDPATLALSHELTQARLDQIRQQKGGGTSTPITPGSREYKVAQDLAYGKLTMPQFRSLYSYSRDINKKLDIYDKASELNPNFNPANFEMGFGLAKNPKVQQQLASMDNVTQAIPDLLKFSELATRTGAPLLNNFVVKGGIALGGKKYSDFKTAQTAFADELSGALGFGSATDMSRQMGFDMTNPKLSPEQFSSAITNVVQPFIERKRSTLLAQMGVYGQPGMNPAAPAAAGTPAAGTPAAAPTGGRGGGAPGGTGQFQVTDPRGVVHSFPSQAQADAFKKAAGIQ